MNPRSDLLPAPLADDDEAGRTVVVVGGTKMLFAAARAYIRCRPGRPADGCQGTGLINIARVPSVTHIEICGCVAIEFARRRRKKPP